MSPLGGSFLVHYDADTREPELARVLLSYSWIGAATGRHESAAYTVWLITLTG